jgi:hypothetical protein
MIPGLLLLIAACNSNRPDVGPLTDFDFLAGTWVQITSSEITEEVWTTSQGWSMHGVGRTLRNGREVSGETLSIEPRGAGFVYIAELPGAAPVEFKLVDHGQTWARFENPEHDFPQRIEYRRNGDLLRAEVSGFDKGATQREITDFRRVRAK